MSTLSGIAAKGEKGKSKFQSLDINNLYRASRGESLETHQHKNPSSRRHGMQNLGKVPSARRPPANLPSLKSEFSGNDPAVNLVPSGGTGWGSKPGETGPPATQVPTSTTPTPPTVTSAPPVIVTVTTTPTTSAPPPPPIVVTTTLPTQCHSDKSWSSITSSGTETTPIFLAHQSPYFQQEFPSLSGDASANSGSAPNKTDIAHLPGPSLRPQTEGSWMQGGSRPQGQMAAGVGNQQATVPVPGPLPHHPQGLDVGGGRNNLGPSGVVVGPAGPIPPANVPPHHFRLMPQFMIRHNHPSGGFPPNFQHGPLRPRFPYPLEARFMPPNRGTSNMEPEEITSRPIIKEEDLKVMDEIARDTGWAAHDEIDYNQTLSFSDEEGAQDEESKTKNIRQSLQIEKRDTDNKFSEKETDFSQNEEKLNKESSRESMLSSQSDNRDPTRPWQQPRPVDFRQGGSSPSVNFTAQPARIPTHQSGRQGEDEEVWRERRRLQTEEIALVVERAKQRKEEEEKRYEESRQAAARKLLILEEKMRNKTGMDKEESSVSPPLNVQQQGSNVLLPDWEKDKEKNRSRKNSEDKDEKSPKESVETFRNLQVDNRANFGRERERDRDRELRPERDVGTQPFSRQFQSNLPPRFQKQAAERPSPYYRQGSGGSPQPPSNGQPTYDVRWPVGQVGTHFGGSAGNTKNHRNRVEETLERDREEMKDRVNDGSSNEAVYDNHEKERFNRPPSRDSRERSHDNSWKGTGYHDEPRHNRSGSEGEHMDNRQYEKSQESGEYNKEKDQEFRFYDPNREIEKKPDDNLNPIQIIQEDPFVERDMIRDNKIEVERRDAPRPERPQRPDSRDSRASRESRNSREDNKLIEENNSHENSLSWVDSSYESEHKEEKRRKERDPRRDFNVMQSYHQRHIPGPITKEKLEASELKCDSSRNINLVPLVRTDKKPETKKIDNQWEQGSITGNSWQRAPASAVTPIPPPSTLSTECWADMSGTVAQPPEQSHDESQEAQTESQQLKVENEETSSVLVKASHQEREEVGTCHRTELQRDKLVARGTNRGIRHDSRGHRPSWGGSFFRGGPWKSDPRIKRAQHRRPNMGIRELGHSDNEASADEVSASTESGKEDKRQDQDPKHFPRSPKQGIKKSEKDDRLRDHNRKLENEKESHSLGNDNRRYEKRAVYDSNRASCGFEPLGEPSRRGRGASFRSRGSNTNVGRRMDGYGPPTSKKPFTSESTTHIHEDKKTDCSQNQNVNKEDTSKANHDDKIKLNQHQQSAGFIGNTSQFGNFKSQPQNIPPRWRRKSEGERREYKPRDGIKHGPQGTLKSGSGSGGEVGEENWETTSETSEHEERDCERDDGRHNDSLRRNYGQHLAPNRGNSRRQSQGNRFNGRDKRRGGSYDRDRDHNSRRSMGSSGPQAMVNGNMRSHNNKTLGPPKSITHDLAESKASEAYGERKQSRGDNKEKRNNLDRIDLCNTASVVVIDDQPEGTVEEDQTVFATDNNGFQEVRSKKNVKEANRQQKDEPQKASKERVKPSKPPSSQSPGPPVSPHPSNITANKALHERPRAAKLPPRFVKLRENSRLQKIAQQQQTQDINELNKMNQGGVSAFPIKDLTSPAPPPSVNAWDKPITASLRTSTPPATSSAVVPITSLADTCHIEVNEHGHSTTSSQRSSPSGEKAVSKLPRENPEKAVLDGSSPPVQTIIFENTNYKSAPVDVAMKSKYANQINKNQRPDKGRERKLEEDNISLGFKSPGPDLKLQEAKTDPIQMPISYNKSEDNADMKLDFRFDSDLSPLTDEKTTSIQVARSIQMAQSSAAELQFKLASVKKVWENPPTGLEHSGEDSSTVSTSTSFTPTFGNSVEDSTSYGKSGVPVVDSNVGEDGSTLSPDGVYNSNQQCNTNTYNGSSVQNMIKSDPASNVCKLLAPQVKPQPQTGMNPHPGPLSPPSGAFNQSPAQPNQHINYQIRDSKFEPKGWIQIRESDSQKTGFNNPSLVYTYLSNCDEPWHKAQPPGADPQQFQQCRPNMTPPTQYGGISTIPSPPTVFTPQAELYPAFQINNAQVMGSQGRSQFSQFASLYPSQGLGQTSGFSQQSMYLHQSAPPPPSAAPPDMFQTQLSQFRIQPPAYGTSQQLSNNPNTVLISSSTNSLMSASVKPSPPPIGAIGSKGPSYQAPSQPPPSQVYIYSDPQLLNQSPFLQNSQLVQRPASNVVPTITPSSASYYSASTGGGATGFFPPGNSNLAAAAHQTTFGMQAFNTQSQAATPAGMGSFGSTFLSNGLQMAQQYRSTAPSYLKSAADHQDVLSVFSSPATQINSPKSRATSNGGGSCGKPGGTNGSSQQQPSPTPSHHKFTAYQQNVSPTTQLMIQQQQQRGSISMRVAPRYPAPIQRPVTFQPVTRHRLPTRYKLPAQPHAATAAATTASHYYVTQNNSSKLDKTDLEAKSEVVSSECESNSTAAANKSTDITKEESTSAND